MNGQRVAALDALRGLAVAVVFLSHAANDGMLPGWLGQGAGQMGVQLFFLLSGYLMMRLYAATPFTVCAARRFIVARAARILPLYWAVVLLSAAAGLAGFAPHYQLADALLPALMLGTAPQELWSVPVEAQFYGVFLLIWWRIDPSPRALAMLLGASVVLAAGWRGFVSEAAILVPYLPAFVAGGWLAAMDRVGAIPRWAGRPMVALLCLAAFVVNLPGIRPLWIAEPWAGFYPRFWLDPVRLLCAMALLATAVAARGSWLAGRPLAWLGHVSFGFYLFHRPVLRWAGELAAPGPGLAALCLAISLLLAALSFALIERPAGRWLRRVLEPPRPAPRPEAG